MKLTTILLFLPILLGAQIETDDNLLWHTGTVRVGSNAADLYTAPPEKPFVDTIQVYALYLTDTITGETKTARVFNERKGNIKGFWGGVDPDPGTGITLMIAIWKTRKEVEQSRFWLPSGRAINKERVLITWPVKK